MSNTVSEKTLLEKIDELESEIIDSARLLELTQFLSTSVDFDTLINDIITFLDGHISCKSIALFIKDADKYTIHAHKGIEQAYTYKFQNDNEGIWSIVEYGKPFIIKDENNINIYGQFFDNNNLSSLGAKVWVPLVDNKNILGLISLGAKSNDTEYTSRDLSFLSKVAPYIARALNKALHQKSKEHNIDDLQKALNNVSILYNIGQAISFIDDLRKLLKVILGKAIQTIGAEKGSLMLYDAASNELVIKVVHGLPDKEVEEKINEGIIKCTRIKAGEGIAGQVFSSKKAIISNLGSNDDRFKQSVDSRVASLLCIPLIVKDEAIGVINITNKQDGNLFNQDDLNFMVALANQAAIAISNAQLYEIAITDGMTKLYTHRHFQNLLDIEIKRATRYSRPISIIMMDLDNFKKINDTYGHQIGDEVLKEAAQVILTTCRKIDIPARYGGEEFIVVLPETTKENARILAERLRQRIERIQVKLKNNETLSPTVSVGLSAFPEHATEQNKIIECADMALYFAKHNGKNCIGEFSAEGCFKTIAPHA